jgi:hypothetical protein
MDLMEGGHNVSHVRSWAPARRVRLHDDWPHRRPAEDDRSRHFGTTLDVSLRPARSVWLRIEPMKKRQLSVEQILGVLKQSDTAARVPYLCCSREKVRAFLVMYQDRALTEQISR